MAPQQRRRGRWAVYVAAGLLVAAALTLVPGLAVGAGVEEATETPVPTTPVPAVPVPTAPVVPPALPYRPPRSPPSAPTSTTARSACSVWPRSASG